jgi:two-component system chemotaxis response regulator CheY
MRKKILVVDDSPSVRQQLRNALSEAGYDVIEAADGEEGALHISGVGDLAAVVCDVNMPRLGGIEMLERVRDRLATLPVLMLTTDGQPALVQRAREVGARGWIVKPFKTSHLLASVEKLTARA